MDRNHYRKLVLGAALALSTTVAADDRELLQAALTACQQQTGEANANALQKIATLTVQRDALQKRVQDLEESAKKAEGKK
jgi:hypothetical protein